MAFGNMPTISATLLMLYLLKMYYQAIQEPDREVFHLDESLKRHARARCLQQFPLADTMNFTDSHETQCFLHCFLYKIGLMDLKTRALDSEKFLYIWKNVHKEQEGNGCMERFNFSEPLTGSCNSTYRKLMEFSHFCWELFEYTFAANGSGTTDTAAYNDKPIGRSATEHCDQLENEQAAAYESLESADVSLISQYKEKLQCIFENIHYLDAYGRIDETEIRLSFQEAHEDSVGSLAVVHICVQKANSKYQPGYLGDAVIELQKCLRTLDRVYFKVFKLRDATSRQY